MVAHAPEQGRSGIAKSVPAALTADPEQKGNNKQAHCYWPGGVFHRPFSSGDTFTLGMNSTSCLGYSRLRLWRSANYPARANWRAISVTVRRTTVLRQGGTSAFDCQRRNPALAWSTLVSHRIIHARTKSHW